MLLETRLPLQTGATMLRRVLVLAAAVNLVFLLVKLSGYVAGQFPIHWIYLSPITAVILRGLFGSARASDCVFGPTELRIDGGKYDGFHIAWTSIEDVKRSDESLRIDLGSGVVVPIASASSASEQRSLEALRQSIVRRTTAIPAGGGSPPAAPTEVVACSACGGPLDRCARIGRRPTRSSNACSTSRARGA